MKARTARPSGPAAKAPADDAFLAEGLTEASAAARHGRFDSHSAMRLLFRAAKPHLSRGDLRWLAVDGSDHAEHLARHMGNLAEGLAGLIQSSGEVDGVATGNFQSHHDLASLLFHFTGVAQQIAGLENVSGEAAAELRERGEA